MDFLTRHRDYFRRLAIITSMAFNFFLILASWSGEEGAWAATFTIAAVAIISSLICHFTQPNPKTQAQ